MGRKILFISDNEIKNLYLKKGLTTIEIGKKLNCSDVTIVNRLKKLGIKRNPYIRRKFRYDKFPFNGSIVEKSYLFGLRVGDLNVYKPCVNSRIIVARCHTTLPEQLNLIRKLFSKFGQVTISTSKHYSYHINCYLDQSFYFLIDKNKIPKWIINNEIASWAFIAGYTDAEGSFGLNQGRGRFKIDSYDYFVLNWMRKFLTNHEIAVKFRQISKKGEPNGDGVWNNNLWRLDINIADSIKKFIVFLNPYLLHEKRIKDAKIVLNNVNQRLKNGTIK